jgi:hypothetical protein
MSQVGYSDMRRLRSPSRDTVYSYADSKLHRVFFQTYTGRTLRREGEALGDVGLYRIEILREPEEIPRVVTFNLRRE